MSKDSFLKNLDDMISSIFSSVLKDKELVEEVKSEDTPQTIEEYTELTGKRFRMTKTQKESGVTRQEAFDDFINTTWRK